MSYSSKLGSQAQLYLNGISLEKPGKLRKSKLPFIIGAAIGTAGAAIISLILLFTGII